MLEGYRVKKFLLLWNYPSELRDTALKHVPVGLLPTLFIALGNAAGIPGAGIAVAVIFSVMFAAYELVEMLKLNLAYGWRTSKDTGYAELGGFCWGIAGSFIIYAILKLAEVL